MRKLAVPLPDYERIFRVIYSVIDEHANTAQACVFFACVGAAILELKYRISAKPAAGAAAIMVRESDCVINTYGRLSDGDLQSSTDAFHCWVLADDVAIDFMAPLYAASMAQHGHKVDVPSKMFQRPLSEMTAPVLALANAREGSFYFDPNPELALEVFGKFSRTPSATDLANVCLSWFVKPPKAMPRMSMRDDEGNEYPLRLSGPTIVGVW